MKAYSCFYLATDVSDMFYFLDFSSNVSFTKNYGIEQSIYEKCHHNITHGSLDFNAPLPLPYYREIWDYKNADTKKVSKEHFQVLISLKHWGTTTQMKTVNS